MLNLQLSSISGDPAMKAGLLESDTMFFSLNCSCVLLHGLPTETTSGHFNIHNETWGEGGRARSASGDPKKGESELPFG